jgi:imidazole glycerol-phosphate synthase subunit HisH
MTVAIIDYGMGNLGSVRRALELLGAAPAVARVPDDLNDCGAAILPGVGAFADGMRHLREPGWDVAIRRRAREGMPLLGICLGMQLLTTSGGEGGEAEGLGLVPGRIRHLAEIGCTERVPHVGWNTINLVDGGKGILPPELDGSDFYFVHSYAFCADDPAHIVATCDYGVTFPAVVAAGAVMGTQYHPEKSSKAGFEVLKSFLKRV